MDGGERPFSVTPIGVTFDGQSFNYAPVGGYAMACQVQDITNPHTAFTVARSGTTYSQREASLATRVYPTFKQSRYPVLCDIGGQSDILAGSSAATILAAMESYHNACRANGARATIISSIPPSTSYNAAMEDVRVGLNELMLNSVAWDVVAPIAYTNGAQDPADTDYYSDGLHPTQLLVDEWTPIYRALIQGVATI